MKKETTGFTPYLALALFLLAVYLIYYSLSLGNELASTLAGLSAAESKINETQIENFNLKEEIQKLTAQLNEKTVNLSKLGAKLDATEKLLYKKESELNSTKKKLSDVSLNLEETKKEFSQLSEEVIGVEKTLNESIQWFKDNAELPAVGTMGNELKDLWYEGFLSNVKTDCINNDGQNKLNLACVSFTMEKTLSFKYISEDPDRLFSLKEIINKDGGDCEDYSLFLKALINTLKKEKTNGWTSIEAWKSDPGYNYQISGKWYYKDVSGVQLEYLGNANPYVICYPMTELQGHCIVALSDKKVTGVEDIGNLEGAYAFEPQNGAYMGKIGTDFHLCTKGERECENKGGSIIVVIGDKDLYQFKNRRWTSYEFYKNVTSQFHHKIEGVLGK